MDLMAENNQGDSDFDVSLGELRPESGLHISELPYQGDLRFELGKIDGHSNAVNHVAISNDGSKAISASDDTNLILWDLTVNPPTTVPLNDHVGPVNHVAISIDGTKAISASDDTNLILWDLTANPPTPTTLDDHARSRQSTSQSTTMAPKQSPRRTTRM